MLKISVSGDAEGGYIVDVHDGVKFGTYRPTAANDHEALAAAVTEHDPELADAMFHDPATETDLTAARAGVDAARAKIEDLTAELAEAHANIEKLTTPAEPPSPADGKDA